MYRSKKEVLTSIKHRTTVKDGKTYEVYTAYLGVDDKTGQKIRIAKKDVRELEKYVQDFYAKLKQGGTAFVSLNEYEATDARMALDLLAASKTQKSLVECVRAFLEAATLRSARAVTLRQAYDEYYSQQMSKHQRKAVNNRVGGWVNDFGGDHLTSDVTAEQIISRLEGKFDNPTSYNNHLTYISTFLNWCMKKPRCYLHENPLDGVDRKTVAFKPPAYIHAMDAMTIAYDLFSMAQESGDWSTMAYFVLSFLCGIRREEILRMASDPEAGKVDIENEMVTVIKVKGWERGEPPRSFHPMPNALAWMKAFPICDAMKSITEKSVGKMEAAAEKLGIKWEKNAGRHTFITMFVAKTNSPATAAGIAGNSEPIVKHHYCNRGVPPKEGEDYFNFLPPTVSDVMAEAA